MQYYNGSRSRHGSGKRTRYTSNSYTDAGAVRTSSTSEANSVLNKTTNPPSSPIKKFPINSRIPSDTNSIKESAKSPKIVSQSDKKQPSASPNSNGVNHLELGARPKNNIRTSSQTGAVNKKVQPLHNKENQPENSVSERAVTAQPLSCRRYSGKGGKSRSDKSNDVSNKVTNGGGTPATDKVDQRCSGVAESDITCLPQTEAAIVPPTC